VICRQRYGLPAAAALELLSCRVTFLPKWRQLLLLLLLPLPLLLPGPCVQALSPAQHCPGVTNPCCCDTAGTNVTQQAGTATAVHGQQDRVAVQEQQGMSI
jgi:hypothetical protein